MNPTQHIIKAFEAFRMAPIPGDQFAEVGRQRMAEKIQPFVDRSAPILFSMLGFPMKSANHRDKTLGERPDLGEEVAIEQFARFDQAIRAHYAPGARFAVVSDGYAFNDLLDTPDKVVQNYTSEVRDMATGTPFTLLEMGDFYRGSLTSMRERMVQQFGITPQELERRIMMDPDVNSLYRGMIRFMTEDIAVRDFPSNTQRQQAAKRLAREMMFRNEAFSALVRKELGDHIRLSMHPSLNNGTKYSFALTPGPKATRSPWHCAIAVHQDGTYETIHRREAQERGYDLQMRHGRPYNFLA